jgi:hypothetical protein
LPSALRWSIGHAEKKFVPAELSAYGRLDKGVSAWNKLTSRLNSKNWNK